VFGEARPYFLDLLRKRYSPMRIGNEVWRGISQLSGAAYDLPQQTREILEDLRLGRLTLNMTDAAMPKTVDRLGRRLFAGLVVASFVVSGTWLLGSKTDSIPGYAMIAFGVLVMLGHVAIDALRRWK